jgi:hypothetical protein
MLIKQNANFNCRNLWDLFGSGFGNKEVKREAVDPHSNIGDVAQEKILISP